MLLKIFKHEVHITSLVCTINEKIADNLRLDLVKSNYVFQSIFLKTSLPISNSLKITMYLEIDMDTQSY